MEKITSKKVETCEHENKTTLADHFLMKKMTGVVG